MRGARPTCHYQDVRTSLPPHSPNHRTVSQRFTVLRGSGAHSGHDQQRSASSKSLACVWSRAFMRLNQMTPGGQSPLMHAALTGNMEVTPAEPPARPKAFLVSCARVLPHATLLRVRRAAPQHVEEHTEERAHSIRACSQSHTCERTAAYSPMVLPSQLFEFFLALGASIDLEDNHDFTPLHGAAFRGHPHIVKRLSSLTKDLSPVTCHTN